MSLPFQFQQLKLDIIDITGLAKDAMHVHIGLIVFVLVRLIWRWRGGWLLAWLVALAVAGTGEYLDYLGNLEARPNMADAEHWHDIWNTMLWPTLLLFIGRWLHPRAKPVDAQAVNAPVRDNGDKEEIQSATGLGPT